MHLLMIAGLKLKEEVQDMCKSNEVMRELKRKEIKAVVGSAFGGGQPPCDNWLRPKLKPIKPTAF